MKITNMLDYWNGMTIVDRASFLESLYVDSELSKVDFNELPTHIKSMLYSTFNHSLNKKEHELSF